jgi:hypothetical protein
MDSPLRDLHVARLDLAIGTRQNLGRNLSYGSVLCPGGPSFLPTQVFRGCEG